MSRILKADFAPSAGVTHTENVLLVNSPSVSGGDFKSPRPEIMSKAEFELRQSLTVLKQMGPLTSREGSKKKVTQSIDLNAQHY